MKIDFASFQRRLDCWLLAHLIVCFVLIMFLCLFVVSAKCANSQCCLSFAVCVHVYIACTCIYVYVCCFVSCVIEFIQTQIVGEKESERASKT